MSRIPPEVVAAVKKRADGACEACGGSLGPDGGVLHHRLLRSRGGQHTEANLLEIHWVCHNGHRFSIHARPRRSERLGHMVPAGTDPATVPVIVVADLLKRRV